MSLIGVTTSTGKWARPYVQSLTKRGAEVRLLLPDASADVEACLEGIDALMLSGGADVDSYLYGEPRDPGAGLEVSEKRDAFEAPVLRAALDRGLPVLAICRGMQLLNVVAGGKLIQDLQGHRENDRGSAYHQVYVAPGSKLAAIIGMGGFYRVNSRHHQGLREAQRAPSLMASAYSLPDGLIEGLESPAHRWVIGVQWHPESEDEVPPGILRLFDAFVERASPGGRNL